MFINRPAYPYNNLSSSSKDGLRINENISASKVRLIDQNGLMIGILDRKEALRFANNSGLDLVEVSPTSNPPVCKILDYGKYKYAMQKKKAEAKKKQKVIEIKEVQMRPVIDENDLLIKCKSIRRFLEEENKVKIVMKFRGREVSHYEIGLDILTKIKETTKDYAKVDQLTKLEGRQIIMILSPKAI